MRSIQISIFLKLFQKKHFCHSVNNCSIDQIFFSTGSERFFVLCVVFKYQYFFLVIQENLFFTVYMYIHISKDCNSLKNCSIDLIFFYRFRIFQLHFFVLWVLWLSKNHEAKMSKNWISWRPSWIFGGHLGLTMGNF